MNGIHVSQMLGNAPSVNLITGIEKENNIPYGYCYCGCGQKTPLAKHTSTRDKTTKGLPTRYLPAHSLKQHHGRREMSHSWKGGEIISSGYLKIRMPNHPNNNQGYIPNSNLVAEKALGKYLPPKAIVHHINKIKTDDRNNNLIVCESVEYHNMLHRREDAYNACGNANWRKCRYCGEYDDPKNMYQEPIIKESQARGCRHRECYNTYQRNCHAKRKANQIIQIQI